MWVVGEQAGEVHARQGRWLGRVLGGRLATARWLPKRAIVRFHSDSDGSGDRLEEPDKAPRYEFRDDSTYVVYGRTEKLYDAKYATDPKADPATLDLDPPSNAVGGTIRGIYKVDGDGDVLTFCWTVSDKVRPRKFESTDDSHIIVFRRIKK
jgi:uncharacterized protein (TIGR03067 family)